MEIATAGVHSILALCRRALQRAAEKEGEAVPLLDRRLREAMGERANSKLNAPYRAGMEALLKRAGQGMTINQRQIALLHVVKAKLAREEETCRQVLVRSAGVTASTDLDRAGFEAIPGLADCCGFRPLAKGAPRHGDRPGMASLRATGPDPRVVARIAPPEDVRRRGDGLVGEVPEGVAPALPDAGRCAQGDHGAEGPEGATGQARGRLTGRNATMGGAETWPPLVIRAGATASRLRGLSCGRPPRPCVDVRFCPERGAAPRQGPRRSGPRQGPHRSGPHTVADVAALPGCATVFPKAGRSRPRHGDRYRC